MKITEQLEDLIPRALKEGNENLGIYKLMKSEFLKAKTDKKRKSISPLSDTEELDVLRKMVKDREDSIEAYNKAARKDLAEIEEKELKLIKSFLPDEPGEEEIKKYLTFLLVSRQLNMGRGLSIKEDMKFLLENLKAKFPESTGKKLSGLILEELNKK